LYNGWGGRGGGWCPTGLFGLGWGGGGCINHLYDHCVGCPTGLFGWDGTGQGGADQSPV